VGRIFCLDAVGPRGRPWMWASGHNGEIRRARPQWWHSLRGGAEDKLGGNRAALTEAMNLAALPWRTAHLAITFY
jgi:hypothetical protein